MSSGSRTVFALASLALAHVHGRVLRGHEVAERLVLVLGDGVPVLVAVRERRDVLRLVVERLPLEQHVVRRLRLLRSLR
jgi:hypothetical protein